MRTGAGTAAATTTGTDARAGTAAATGSGCPRLTRGAVRLNDPILGDRSDDLTAADRGTGERQEARKRKRPRSLSSVPQRCQRRTSYRVGAVAKKRAAVALPRLRCCRSGILLL